VPHFLDDPEMERKPNTFANLMRSFVDRIDEYEALDPMIKRALSFEEHRLGTGS